MSDRQQAPLSKTQMGIYVECMAHPDYTTYNLPFLIKMDKTIDTVQLEKAVYKAIEAHPCLETVLFAGEDGTVMQRISKGSVRLKEYHMSEEAFSQVREKLVRTFDLDGGTLARFEIYRTPSAVYLFEDVHHIILDGTAHHIMMRDLWRAYEGQELQAETYTGLDVAVDEAAAYGSEEYKQAKTFFGRLLDGVETDCLPSPDRFSDEPAQDCVVYRFSLDQKRLKDFRKENGISTTAFFTGVAGFLIAKYNYREQSVISTVYNARDGQKQHVVSMLVRTLPFVTDFCGNPTIADFLKQENDVLMEERRQELYSFEEMAGDYGIRADINFAFQGKLLDYQSTGREGALVERLEDARHIEQTPLIMELSEIGGGVYELRLGYRADMFSRFFAENLAHAYGKISAEFLEKERVDEVELADEESRAILETFHGADEPYEPYGTVVDQVRAQTVNDPDKTAVVYLDRRYSYREVDDLSDRLAGELLRRGLRREDVVGILIPKNEYIVIGSLGVLKAGGAYMPMDPSYPSERLQFMLKDAGVKILLTTRELEGRITQDFTGERMFIETIPNLPAADRKLPDPGARDLFILLYTSGSTGLPKGVMMEHGNLMSLCTWARRYYAMDGTARGTAYASYGFDASMFETWPLLTAGGTLYIIDESIRLNLTQLQDYFNQNKITHSFMTTQVGRQFALLEGTTTLKSLSVGGEKLAPLDPPAFHLHNLYGPTECTVLVTAEEVTRRQKDVPIGRAVDHVRLYIVDKNGKCLPPGAAGELLIAGAHVARSYLNRPEQTAAAFTSNPFCAEKDYERLYHTGDVVRFLEDGSVQFIGRRDAQVKVRGFRIELTEVEEVISRFPGIKDVTVAAYDDPAGGKYLAAYVVSDAPVSVAALNAFILQEKPSYMVPAVTMQIDHIPMNQNQKVDRRSLPVPERRFENVKDPENETQKRIYDLVTEVIGHSGFGVNTDLYQAGLTSVGCVRLNVLLAKAFGRDVQIRDLKENNTIEKLERFLMSESSDEDQAQKDEEIREDYPLSRNQEGIFVETMAHPGSTVYNIPVLLELSSEVDLHRLTTAAADAVEAHPYIKTRLFMNEAGEIRQKRMDAERFLPEDVEWIRYDHFDPVRENLSKPFTLLGGRLFRIAVIASDKKYLFVEMHHIISDGTSMNLFLQDISKAYRGEKLQIEAYSGFDAAAFEEEQRKSSAFERARDYYKKLLDGTDPDSLPEGDGAAGEEMAARAELFGKYALADDVRRFCQENRLSENGFFTSIFGLVISKYTGKEDTVFVTIYNGRSDSRLAGSVAMLVKTLPVRLSISKDSGNISTEAFVSDVSGQLLESMTNDICSFAEISREWGIRADVMFAYQGGNFAFDEICGYPARLIRTGTDQTKAPLNLVIDLQDGRIHYDLEYNGARFSRAFAEAFLDAMDMAVSELLTKERVGEVSILSPGAKQELMNFNDTAGPVSPLTVPEMLEQQALSHPDKIAVTAGEEALTYSELNRRSNIVAYALLQERIRPEDRAAFCMKRTVDVYAVREGILKAGGAFLALDPEYPDERILYILNDAEARFLVIPAALYDSRKTLFDRFSGKVLLLEDLLRADEAQAETNPEVSIDPEGLAYCIYTSGSTGKPKGVMIEHRNLMNMLSLHEKNILARDYVENTTVFLGLAAFTFDVSIIEELMPLCHGQTVAMATEDEIHNPVLLADMMERRGVDMMKCTPSYMFTMLELKESSRVLSRLTAMIIGAEPFPSGLYEKIRAAGFTGKIFNSYGPTETTVTVTIDELDGKHVTIGRPAGNTGIFMRDLFGNVLPKFARGELVISGKSVGRGYVGLDGQTAEKFISLGGEKAYRSGDVAWWNAEGKIIHCGRTDNQVKLRGLRVELDEIGNAMNLFQGIRQSVVLVKGEGASQFLCGYYVADQKADTEKLREYLGRTLAEYMIPSVFVHLTSMPMTPNGKVDRRSLPEPAPEAQNRSGREPKTDLEKKFCEMFASILGTDHVYADDDFFALGGTSLSASRIAIKCMVEKINVVYADVFRFGTPEKLAAYVEGQEGTRSSGTAAETTGSGETASEPTAQKISAYEDGARDEGPIREVLRNNNSACVSEISGGPLGNVLVTGATGFLGIHVVRELLRSGEIFGVKKIYCLVRRGKSRSVEQRMKMMLMYYFDNPYEEEIGARILPVEGDITEESLADKLSGCDFDTVINCAASVKHFAADDLLERVNVEGVRNLIRICRLGGKKLIQISTVSVAGESVDNHIPETVRLRENTLNLGQVLDNAYARSKYQAEELVLRAVAEGLRGKVIRVGNLMSRSADGEFQINNSTSAFMNRLRAYHLLRQFPVDAMDQEVELSPIDSTARAIVLLAGTADEFTVFHAYNCHSVHMANVIEVMNAYGMQVEIVSKETFERHFQEVLADDTQSAGISGMINYMNSGKGSRRYVGWENHYTVKALYRLGFSWPLTGEEYIRRLVDALSTLGFFGIE